MALVLKPHASENDALMVDLLNAGDLGSACIATVIQIMTPQSCPKYSAGLVRVVLYIHNCCNSDGTTRSDCRGILLLWDRQQEIAALFEEGDTLLLQFPVWVSSYDADDIAGWASGVVNPVLLEVGAQSVLFVHPAELQPAVLTMMAGKLPFSLSCPGDENAGVCQMPNVPINLHSCLSARITTGTLPLRAPVAIVADAAATDAVVCPQIEALDLTFVHALPLPILLCDVSAGMRGLCSLVQVLSCECVHVESAAAARAAKGLGKSRIIVHGGGRGCDLSVSCAGGCAKEQKEQGAISCQNMYKISDGWGVCNLLLPPDMYDPSMLLQKTVLISGFDCRALVTSNDVNGASVCSEDSELRRCVVLLPQSCCRVMPIAANIGLALSAAAHNGAFSEVISALELLAGGKSMVAVPRVCSSSPTWFPSHAVAATLLSVMEGIEEAGCSVLLQDRNGCVIQLTCSLSTELQAAELVPLVGSSVVCVLTLKTSTECVQVEGIYRC